MNNKLGDEIVTSYGVAQGRNSSPNLYSFYVSDMPTCTNELDNDNFMDPYNIAQLADDSIVIADNIISLKKKMYCLLNYSKQIFQIPNISKTVFCHFAENPLVEPIYIDAHTSISSVNITNGHRYFGMKFVPTNDLNKIIEINLNERIGKICKFYSWLELNEETPIEIKLIVLDNCIFSAILYAVETWSNITYIKQRLKLTEQKALKAILKVKKGTSTDLIYNELKRADIISRIKDSQWKFYQRLLSLNLEDALVKSFMMLCNDTPMIAYYNSLTPDNKSRNILDRERRIFESDGSMVQYYASNINVKEKCAIYKNFIDDKKRAVITRWRLSNHKLLIETGRYSIPPIPRDERKCSVCNILEDESHAIFFCPKFGSIRRRHKNVLEKYYNIKLILNPDVQDIHKIPDLLLEIDNILNNR